MTIQLFTVEFWCPYARRTGKYSGRLIGYSPVGRRFSIEDCLNPCQLRGSEQCVVGWTVEGPHMDAKPMDVEI